MALFQNKYKNAADEFAWHLEQRTQELIKQGMPPEEAAMEARKRLGNMTSLTEETAEVDSFLWLETVKRDFFLALRMLRRAPTVSIIAIASLGLGIGANIAVFTLMKQVVLDYLPVPSPERLLILHNKGAQEGHVHSDGMKSSFSYPLYRDLNAATAKIFEGIAAFRSIDVSLTGRESAETVHGGLVSGNFFQVLQVSPWRGRLFNGGDAQKPGGDAMVVLGYGLWRRAFGGDPKVIHQTVLLNKHPYVVVGVAPPQFYGIDVSSRADLYVPITMKADVVPDLHALDERLDHWASLIGRLKSGVTIQQAAAALSVLYPPLRDQDIAFMKSPSKSFLAAFAKNHIELTPGGQGYASLRDDLGNPIKILMAMVGIVLLITVVNVANLLIARGVARQQEMAIRLSVGAGRATLIRQLLIESVVLASLGGLFGVALAYTGTPVLLHVLSLDLSTASISAHPDARVMLFAAAITLLAGLLFGLLPAWQSARTNVGAALKTDGSFGHSGGAGWLRRGLVVSQIALSLALLTSALLFTRSLQNLEQIDIGFDARHLVTFSVNPLQAGYSQPRIKSFAEDLRLKLMRIQGVEGASAATVPLLVGDDEGGDVTVEGAPELSGDARAYDRNFVGPDFFSTLRIPLLAGRAFSASDLDPAGGLAIVNQSFVKRFIPGRNPLGVHFGFGTGNAVVLTQTIIGVVADSKYTGIRLKINPVVYLPYLAGTEHLSALHFYLRNHASVRSLSGPIRQVIHQLDANLPVNELSSMTDVIDESLFVERSLGYLSAGFAILATLLALVGLYGVMSYSVSSRTREIGIRMAIGATPRRVLTMVLKEAAYLGVAGTLLGIPLLFATTSYIRSSLYGVPASNALVCCSAIALLIAVALLAGLVPALQAARLDAQTTLRSA